MGLIKQAIDFILHLDKYLSYIINNYGGWTYAILLLMIFCETGLVVTPFLPGDSLVFAAGAFAAKGDLNIIILFSALSVAAVAGDTVNYHIGYYLGPKVFNMDTKLFKKEYLIKTHNFYEKHGGKTIIIARFIPIIRTFAPFVAGVGGMKYKRFISFNIIGGISWVALFTFGGYFFGSIDFVKNNFSIVIFAIIFISILPGIFEFIRQKYFVKEVEG